MKGLSLRQPWADIVVRFGKNVENRRWNTHYRGPFLIHASKGMTRRDFRDAMEFTQQVFGDRMPTELQIRSMLHFGGIVGRARLVDVVPPCGEVGARCTCRAAISFGRSWHMPEQYGFILDEIASLPFRPCTGRLGFFEVPTEARSGDGRTPD